MWVDYIVLCVMKVISMLHPAWASQAEHSCNWASSKKHLSYFHPIANSTFSHTVHGTQIHTYTIYICMYKGYYTATGFPWPLAPSAMFSLSLFSPITDFGNTYWIKNVARKANYITLNIICVILNECIKKWHLIYSQTKQQDRRNSYFPR